MSNYEQDLASLFDKYADKITIQDRRQLRDVLNETISAFMRELADEDVNYSEIEYPTSEVAKAFFEDLVSISVAYKLDTEEIIEMDKSALHFLNSIRAKSNVRPRKDR